MYFHSIKQNLYVIKQLALTDFKLRYNGSVLGYLWALLKPLMIFIILNFVFSNIFGNEVENYSLKLLTGLLIWNFFSEGTMIGLHSILNKASILTKIYIPKWAVVIASSLHVLVSFVLNLGVLSVFFVFYDYYPAFTDVLLFLFYCCLTYILILAFSFFTAPLYVKFRDLNQIWEVMLTAGFYAVPILYPMSAIPDYLHWVLHLNPMTFIVQYSQAVLFHSEFNIELLPNILYILILAAGLIIALITFKKLSLKIVEEI